ncbi:MAG: D-alanine--D-alanine ligase [Holosporales bacterium]|jgi:D-alanine-D-alanine ligase|nr:D-alanine--D-alanine ligase [Holosporales bacterium]
MVAGPLKQKGRVAVLLGGWSSEREVSLNSGKNVAKVLRGLGYEIAEIDVQKDLRHFTDALYNFKPDFVFNILHGSGGEDGIVQGVLEMYGVPYSGSSVLGSALTFNKSVCKKLARFSGIRVADWIDIKASEIPDINTKSGKNVPFPFIVKPSANGSSVGVYLIFGEDDLSKLKEVDWTFGDDVMLEKYIPGREFTVMALNGKTVGGLEIRSKAEFYDYSSKYDVGGSVHIPNFEVDKSVKQELYSVTGTAYDICHCSGVARADFRYDGENVYFLEINTQPGMTELSLVPDIARANGISIEALIEAIVGAQQR